MARGSFRLIAPLDSPLAARQIFDFTAERGPPPPQLLGPLMARTGGAPGGFLEPVYMISGSQKFAAKLFQDGSVGTRLQRGHKSASVGDTQHGGALAYGLVLLGY